jgi:DNA-binding NarL/FixJ family response regulator
MMTLRTPRNLLLIEDNPGFAGLVRALLDEARDMQFRFETVDRLGAGLERVAQGGIEVVLLDLGLPDSQGLDTFLKARANMPQIPIIVLTGMDDDDLALEAVWAGAQDFLVKGKFDAKMLAHTLRYAIERESVRVETDRQRQQDLRDREISSLHRLADPPVSPWTKPADHRSPSPRSGMPVARDLLAAYAELMEIAPQRKHDRAIDARITEGLRRLAQRYGQVGAGPESVVALHDAVLRAKTEGVPPPRALAYLEEGRRLVLELMGHLVTYYRERLGGGAVDEASLLNNPRS